MSNLNQHIEAFKKISNKSHLDINDPVLFHQILDFYFATNRPQVFSKLLVKDPSFIEKILNASSFEFGTRIANLYFLFYYNLAQEDYFDVQNEIYDFIAVPYKKWINDKKKHLNISPLIIQNPEKKITFISRHAVCSGMYAPSQTTFTFAESLLKKGLEVQVIFRGQCDQLFLSLKQYHNFSITQVPMCHSTLGVYFELRKILQETKSSLVFTEIEFDAPSLLSIFGTNIPVILLSSGYYKLPWYDKIAIYDVLQNDKIKMEENFIQFPFFTSEKILNPPLDKNARKQVRDNLGIKNEEFLVGSFNRMEKFSYEYLTTCEKLLKKFPRIKFIFAGPNDNSKILEKLNIFIKSKRVIVLPASDVHLLGIACDAGFETYPLFGGSSILELMAKNKPVISVKNINPQRDSELNCSNDDEVIDKMGRLLNDKKFLLKKSSEANSIIKKSIKDDELYQAIKSNFSEFC